MRLPDSRFAVSLAVLLSATALSAQTTNGPAADYPVVIGAPFEVEGTTFTPLDTLNYDAVGRVQPGSGEGEAITGAHHTLPVPSYVEVTSLESGRTILVRLNRRGPMNSARVIELSPAAMAQLGIASQSDAAVRVRRVNPPEVERAMLRSGGPAPARMDTPMGLVGVLKRKLDQQEGKAAAPQLAVEVPAPAASPAQVAAPPQIKVASKPPVPAPAASSAPVAAPPQAKVASKPPVPAKPKQAQSRPAPDASGRFVVQVGAFANQANAARVAKALGTEAAASGKLWRVRLGPFAGKAEADAALAKARAAGYSDARIQRAG